MKPNDEVTNASNDFKKEDNLNKYDIKSIKNFIKVIKDFRTGMSDEESLKSFMTAFGKCFNLNNENVQKSSDSNIDRIIKTNHYSYSHDVIEGHKKRMDQYSLIFDIIFNSLEESRTYLNEETRDSILPTGDCSLDGDSSDDLDVLEEQVQINDIMSNKYKVNIDIRNVKPPIFVPKFNFSKPLVSK